jgi:hypothetical protein
MSRRFALFCTVITLGCDFLGEYNDNALWVRRATPMAANSTVVFLGILFSSCFYRGVTVRPSAGAIIQHMPVSRAIQLFVSADISTPVTRTV